MALPRVSVVIPAFNCSAYIGDAINSVLTQTFTSWEVLIVDDGSTDDTREDVSEFVTDGGRLLTHDGGANRGACLSRIVGTEDARGDVVALLDADDIWDDCYLENHLVHWDSVAEFGVAMSYGRVRIWHPSAPDKDRLSMIPTVGVHNPGTLLA